MSIATITKDFAFSASHRLDGLPETHQCARLHGHNYVIRVGIAGPVGPVGFVVDYGELAPVKGYIDDELDHRHLNDLLDFNPTAEHLAGHLVDVIRELVPAITDEHEVSVAVSETPKTWATVTG